MIDASGNERFVYDSYRRLIMMYADVVMEKALKLNKSSRPIRELMEKELDSIKKINVFRRCFFSNQYDFFTLFAKSFGFFSGKNR